MTAVQSHTWTTLNLFSQFSTVSHPNHGYQHQQRPQTPAMNTTTTATTSSSYTAPAVISLGEEYTDATLPEHSSYLSLEEENGEEDDGGFMDYDDDACSTTSSEESSPCSPSSSRRNSARKSIIPALWHAEQARLINIQTAVLEKERRVRSRELKLESEVARIKTDLARLKQARTEQAQAARLSWLAANHPTTTTATTSSNTTSDSATTSPTAHKRTSTGQQSVNSTTTPASRVTGPRGPRPRPQPQTTTTTTNSRSDATPQASLAIKFESEETVAPVEKARPESQLLPLSMSFDPTPPSLGKFNFEAAPFEEDHAVTESLLASHLTEARSARAQERHKRKIEHERIRELSMLLTLGSEVRKWEERLAWNQSRSRGTCSDDMSIIESGGQKEREDAMDTDPDPRFKRLSRSFSVPSRGSFVGSSPSASTDKKAPLPLPSLSDSPLWRVSAEMILRRGSRSERPRRPPVAPPAATVPATSAVAPSAPTSSSTTLTRPSHVLRGPREQRSTNSASTSPSSSSPASTTMSPSAISPSSQDGSSSVVPSSATSSGKRYSIPPPITIPSNTQFCNPTSNMAGVLPATAGATVSGQTAAGEAQGEAETFKGFGERPAHPQSAQVYSGNNGFFGSRSTTPIKPSSLKWAFTADDLAKELESQKTQDKKDGDVEMHSPTSSTSGESESDDSYKSSSEGSSQPVAAPQPVERRGRARFSWRRSIPKDSTNTKEEIPAVPPVHIGA